MLLACPWKEPANIALPMEMLLPSLENEPKIFREEYPRKEHNHGYASTCLQGFDGYFQSVLASS